MKIFKYLFLLLLLSFVTFSIFVATFKGDFSVERSKFIKSSNQEVYNYVNDTENWNNFMYWIQNNGEIKTFGSKKNVSISQKLNYDGISSDLNWTFKDTIGGTIVTLKNKGTMDFILKIKSILNGEKDNLIGQDSEKSLENLDRNLDYEANTYSIKVEGIVNRPVIYYLHQSFTSKISNVISNIRIVSPKITEFCTQNNIVITGKPFVIYHTYDLEKDLAKISICIPIANDFPTTEASSIKNGSLEPFETVKTILKGAYSHTEEVVQKTQKYLNLNRIATYPKFSHIEVFSVGKAEIMNSSKWVTEFYFITRTKIDTNQPTITNTVVETKATIENTTTEENLTKPATETTVINKPKPTLSKPKVETLKPESDTNKAKVKTNKPKVENSKSEILNSKSNASSNNPKVESGNPKINVATNKTEVMKKETVVPKIKKEIKEVEIPSEF